LHIEYENKRQQEENIMEITARQAVGVLVTILLPYIVLGITMLLMMDGRYIAWVDRHIEKLVGNRTNLGVTIEGIAMSPLLFVVFFGTMRISYLAMRLSQNAPLYTATLTMALNIVMVVIYYSKQNSYYCDSGKKRG
jgi:hypothetical protein